jgi:hypothetical protein
MMILVSFQKAIAHNVQATRKASHNAVVVLGKKERGLERAQL